MPHHILYVEDHKLVANAVKDTLNFAGWHVTLCADGVEGLAAIESDTHYDLLLCDYDLPHIEGWRLIAHARTLPHRQHLPIILLSGQDYRIVAREIGADVFLRKPEGINQLVSTITQLLNAGT
jgi:DNA-binding response OmpR family regulator